MENIKKRSIKIPFFSKRNKTQNKLKRPLGITLLSIIYFLAIPLSLIIAGIVFMAPTVLQNIPEFNIPLDSIVLYSLGVFLILFAILCFFLARGLWKGKKRARNILIIISTINVLGSLISVILRKAQFSYIGIVFNILVILYITINKKVKQFFKTTA